MRNKEKYSPTQTHTILNNSDVISFAFKIYFTDTCIQDKSNIIDHIISSYIHMFIIGFHESRIYKMKCFHYDVRLL